MASSNQHISDILKSLPDKPGVYQYFNVKEELIYVGKAKSLKKRVGSYFAKEHHDSAKTTVLVRNIVDIKFILTDTELDALLLENNLIKKHQPRYNINLKDDKTYPWICITNEPFPRVFYTRKMIKGMGQYFGPYANVGMVKTLLEFTRQLFPTRTCRLKMTETTIAAGKFRICLEYHIGNCKGPCEGYQTHASYMETIANIRDILKGDTGEVIQHLKNQMQQAASAMKFEEAQLLKDKLEQLENYRSKSVVVSSSITNVDVYSIVSEGDYSFVNYMRVVNGAIIQSHTVELKRKLDETPAELLSFAITDIREKLKSVSREIIVPIEPEIELPNITYTIPKLGDKRRLLELSEKNVRYFMKDRLEQYDKVDPDARVNRLMEKMKNDLHLNEQPRHIECFDNSNFQGEFAVAAMSVFKDGRPSKRDYRHFNIKTVEGPNDFASMEEIIYRRYKRVLDEKEPLPQLIIIDGGKGQLSAALNSLEKLELRGKIAVISIAKKLEEIYYPGDPHPMYLDKKSETLRIIQQLRDEVHRFGITHHRNVRSKGSIKTDLSNIKGIGEATSTELLKHFKSVKRIKEAAEEELAQLIGPAKARLVKAHFEIEEKPF